MGKQVKKAKGHRESERLEKLLKKGPQTYKSTYWPVKMKNEGLFLSACESYAWHSRLCKYRRKGSDRSYKHPKKNKNRIAIRIQHFRELLKLSV